MSIQNIIRKSTAALILILSFHVSIHGQIADIQVNPDSLNQEMEAFNNSKEEIEQLIKQRECITDLAKTRELFLKELAFIDSVIGVGQELKLPQLTEGNKLLIVGKWMEGDKCIFIMYPTVKFLPGCEEPFLPASIDWSVYTNLSLARRKGTVCLQDVQSSGFTQVEKIQSVEITPQSAEMLLKQIKRVLSAYPEEIGVEFDQYQPYEKGKEIGNLKDLIAFRLTFLKYCIQKIKA